jgi:hypothetical protein
MTANELKEQALLLFDKQFEWAAPAYDDRQISKVLTDAQLIVTEDIYSPRKDGEDFESSELSRRRLEQLIKSASLSGGDISASATQTGVHPQGTFYDLPEDFFLAIEEAATTAEMSTEAQVKPVEHNFYTQNISNPYKKPYKKVIWRMDISRVDHGEDGGDAFTGRTPKRTELIVANKTTYPITDYRLRYLSYPPDIVCDEFTPANQRHSILESSLHPKIVREAVKIMTASVKPEEYQIAVNEQKENI